MQYCSYLGCPLIDGDAKDTARLVNNQNHFFGLGPLDILFSNQIKHRTFVFWSLSVVQKKTLTLVIIMRSSLATEGR